MIQPVPTHPERLAPALPEWELYIGSIHLYIVGPGPDAMRKCSLRNINPGTATERDLAWRAIEILNELHRENKDAGPAEILAALVVCGYQEEAA